MIRVVAVITAKPGRRDDILAAFSANVPAVRAEQGCIEYAAHVDAAGIGPFQAKFGPDTFVVLETWASPRRPHRRPAHGGLWEENQGPDRQPRDPRPLRDRVGPSRLLPDPQRQLPR
jgi:quinol monooxygenase YgiN